MRTLLLSQVFPPQTGGSGRWFWEIYRRLPRETICVVAGEHPRSDDFDSATTLRIHRMPMSLATWGFFNLPGCRGYWREFRRLQQLISDENVQVIHAGCVLSEGWLAYMFKLWMGLPYTVYVHGEELNIGARSRELGWMMRRVFNRADRIIVNSRNTRHLLQNGWGLSPAKVNILHPGVDTTRFCPAPRDSAIRRTFGWSNREVVLTVGRLQKRKGHDMLLRALPQIQKSVPNVLYAIVGDGDQRDVLTAMARDLGVDESVQFLGEPDDDVLIRCYQQCDLFALPNREVDGDIEGFGMVLLEAQACGKPVIAGDSGGTAETLQDGLTGEIVDCTSPGPLADAVVRVLSSAEHRTLMGRAARKWVVERFDWCALAEEAAQLFGFESLAADAASTAAYRRCSLIHS